MGKPERSTDTNTPCFCGVILGQHERCDECGILIGPDHLEEMGYPYQGKRVQK